MVDQPYHGQRRDDAEGRRGGRIEDGTSTGTRSTRTDGAVASGFVQGLTSMKNMESWPDVR